MEDGGNETQGLKIKEIKEKKEREKGRRERRQSTFDSTLDSTQKTLVVVVVVVVHKLRKPRTRSTPGSVSRQPITGNLSSSPSFFFPPQSADSLPSNKQVHNTNLLI